MTIKQLLERVSPGGAKYDQDFEIWFKSLMKKVRKDRDDLNDAGRRDTKAAAKKFLGSWMQVLDLFADDPRSLAAFTAPEVKIRGKDSCTTTIKLFTKLMPQTNTVFPFLYESAAEQAESKPKPSTSKSKTASKKVKASKRK